MPTASSAGDRQRKSSTLSPDADPPLQTLPARRQRLLPMGKMQAIDHQLVRQQPTLLASVKLCISMAGFESDKEVYIPLGIDAGHWSRIIRGEAHFPIDKLCDLMDLCGNEAPLLWLIDERGYDLASMRRKESETEARLRKAQEEIDRMKAERLAERRLLADLMTGRVTA